MFDWNFLPMAGGILDQDPEWLKSVRTINYIKQEEEERQKKKKEGSEKFRREQGLA